MDVFADSHSWDMKADTLKADGDWPGLITHCRMWLENNSLKRSGPDPSREAYNHAGRYRESLDPISRSLQKDPMITQRGIRLVP